MSVDRYVPISPGVVMNDIFVRRKSVKIKTELKLKSRFVFSANILLFHHVNIFG